jgi:polyhydroxyalkanoate synthase subunit PhaC
MLRNESAASPQRLEAALRGLRAYQSAPRTAGLPTMPVLARVGRACIRDYGGSGAPVLFVPSLINPPDILDLDEQRSLLRWLRDQGVRPLLLDWGSPDESERDMSVAGHVEQLLLPLLDSLNEPVALAGYCLGGTMAIAAAAVRPVSRLVLLATPWRFGAYSPDTLAALADLWAHARSPAEAIGMFPMEVLQAAFWRLDPTRTVDKFIQFGALDPADPKAHSFVRLEDWANDGPPLTFGAARELFEGLFAQNLPERGGWQVAGRTVDASSLHIPTFEITSITDRIVPAATTPGIGRRLDLELGHVGMIVGGRAREALWKPLAAWLSSAEPN